MENELMLLLWGAGSIAFIHTLLGPDHYLPFVAVGKARGWGASKTGFVTLLCGLGHSVGSIVLGLIGVFAGGAISNLLNIESIRGDFAAWSLLAFGLVYLAWGVKKSFKDKTHKHWHLHMDGTSHQHMHNHHSQHAHVHEAKAGMKIFAPWALFIIFVLGPCEPLIPLMMVPASQGDIGAVMATVLIFTAVTILTMLMVVTAATFGLRNISFKGMEKYSHAFAGGTISMCAFGMLAFGL